MKRAFAFVALIALASPAIAQEQEDFSETVTPIKGGAIFDQKMDVDGSLISEQHFLTHIVCSKNSKTLRVMLPLAPDDDGTTYTMDGAPSSLKQDVDNWQLTFLAYGKPVTKHMVLKPTNDKSSQNKQQFMFDVTYRDALWNAMMDKEPGKAVALIGTGGTPVSLPYGNKFDEFLALCGLS